MATPVFQPTGLIVHATFNNEQRVRDILFSCLTWVNVLRLCQRLSYKLPKLSRESTSLLRFERTCMTSEIFLKSWSSVWAFQCRLLQLSDVPVRAAVMHCPHVGITWNKNSPKQIPLPIHWTLRRALARRRRAPCFRQAPDVILTGWNGISCQKWGVTFSRSVFA